MSVTTFYGPTGIPYTATEIAPCAAGILVTVAPYTRFAITPHPSGVEDMPPLILADGDTLRLPPDKVRELVDARQILDPATGEVKPPDPPVVSRMGITYYGSQDDALEKYNREAAAEKAKLAGKRGYVTRGRSFAHPTWSFDPLGPIEGVDY
jgi:hypothetical protein